MLETLRTARGVMRSLGIYYGWQQRGRPLAMDALYARFVKSGDLVFDIGAHVGDRVAAFRRLGAKVVAVEPQRALNFVIGMMYGRDDRVVIERVAVGRKTGDVRLMINTDNPTISTASDAFIHAAQDAPGWQGQQWDKSVSVPMTTLDALIAEHGVPAFIKIDIEGFEEEALLGLTQPVAALSIPLAVFTARPALGRLLTRIGIGRLPEETAPPLALTALALPAVTAAARPA